MTGPRITFAAKSLAGWMTDLRSGTVTPDDYRAFVRRYSARFTAQDWQRITFAAAAMDSRR